MENEKVVPLPREREIITLLGEDNEVNGYISHVRANKLGGGWVAVFQSGITDMAKMGLTGEQWNVWAYLMGTLDFDNYWRVSQKEVAEALGMHKQHVSRAIHVLLDKDIIIEGPMAGRFKTYRLNPRIAHRGAKNYQETVIQYDALKKAQLANKGEGVND